jgi:hypothetical protein
VSNFDCSSDVNSDEEVLVGSVEAPISSDLSTPSVVKFIAVDSTAPLLPLKALHAREENASNRSIPNRQVSTLSIKNSFSGLRRIEIC